MANSKNLKPIRTESEAREKGKKGGIKSGEIRREKRKLRELLEMFLEMNAPQQMKDKALEIIPELGNERLSLKATLVIALIERITKGDMKAFEIMRDTIGEKPVDKIKNDVNCTVESGFESVEAFAKHFKEMIGE